MSLRDVHALVAEARDEEDGDRQWELLCRVTRAGPTVVRRLVEGLIPSDDVRDVALGADIVSAMPYMTVETAAWFRDQGYPMPDVAPFTAEDCESIAVLLGRALNEQSDPWALESCVIAAGKLGRPELLDAVLRHVGDDDADVREACAWSLPWMGKGDSVPERAVAALVALADDPVGAVRDWAITALGGYGVEPIDTPQTRRVFREHVDDSDEDARQEAICALGLLGDVEMLARWFDSEDALVSTEAIELAARLADPRLHEPLLRLQDRGWARTSDVELDAQLEEVLQAALDATDPQAAGRRPPRSDATAPDGP